MGDEDTGLDFSYESYLAQVPEGLRTQIEPAFKEYSESLQKNFEPYKPYAEVNDQGWTPEHVTAGLGLLQELNSNPQRIFQALAEQNPELLQQFTPQQTPQIPAPNPFTQQQPSADMSDVPPWLAERMEQQEKIIGLLYEGFNKQQEQTVQQQQAQREQEELTVFKNELDKVAPETRYPRHFILSYISQGQSPQDAVKSFDAWKAQELAAQRSSGAPVIAPAGGGGLPSEPIDTSKLNDEQRRALMVQYMEAANRQNN